jgi:hypothetical protein
MADKRQIPVTRDQVEIAKLAVEAARRAGRKPSAVAEKVAKAESNGS